jgi:hypothetical protein
MQRVSRLIYQHGWRKLEQPYQLVGYAFTPPSLSATITNANVPRQDFSATRKFYMPLVLRR